VDNFILMEKLEPDKYISKKELGLFLIEESAIAEVVAQVSSIEVVHDEVEVLSILEGVGHIDEKGMGQFRKKLFLIHYRCH
jgi:hypothetical protein